MKSPGSVSLTPGSSGFFGFADLLAQDGPIATRHPDQLGNAPDHIVFEFVIALVGKHELEDNMVWRIAELIGVSSRDRTILRKQISEAKKA